MPATTIRIAVNPTHAHLFTAPTFVPTNTPNVFNYTTNCRYDGDDETVVFTLWGDLPAGVPEDVWEILWETDT